jgi:hypothetical protein
LVSEKKERERMDRDYSSSDSCDVHGGCAGESEPYRLSEKCSVYTSSQGPCVKFTKTRNDKKTIISFSVVYWSIFLDHCMALKSMLEDKTSHVIHGGGSKNMDNDRGNARLEVGFWDYKEETYWHVGLHFETETRQRIKGGLNLSVEEFRNLMCFVPQIDQELDQHKRQKEMKRKDAAGIVGVNGPSPKMPKLFPVANTNLIRAMECANITNCLYRYKLPGGDFSNWKMFKAMCVEDIKKDFPEMDPNEFEFSQLREQNGGLDEVLELIVAAILTFFSKKRAETTCSGCNMNPKLIHADIIDEPELFIQDACDKGCHVHVSELAKKHWAVVKPMLTAEHAAKVCTKFLSYYGPGYNFTTQQLIPICKVVINMCRPSLFEEISAEDREDRGQCVEDLLAHDSGNFTDAVRFIENLIERER